MPLFNHKLANAFKFPVGDDGTDIEMFQFSVELVANGTFETTATRSGAVCCSCR
jgi:hypothetical protein